MRKRILLILLAVLVVVGLAACGTKGPKKGQGEKIDFSQTLSKKTEISVWLDDEGGEYAKALIEAFNATEDGKDIAVIHRHEGSVESRERLKTVGPTGGGPDVFQFPHDHLSSAILEDLVFPLPQSTRELVDQRSHPIGAKIAKVQYDETTGVYGPGSNTEEKLYAMPTSVESVGLYYNKKLISEADVPKTMEDLITKAEVWNLASSGESGLTNLDAGRPFLTTSNHWADSYFMQGFYSAHGFQPFGDSLDDKNNVGFTSTEMKNALTWFRDSLKPIVTGTSDDTAGQGSNFEAGHIPLTIAGPWNIEAYQSKGKDVIDLGIAQMPSINGKASKTYAGSIMTAVYQYSKNKTAAVKFVEFLNSDKAMELLYKHKGKLPALKTELLPNIPGVTDDALLMAMSKQLETSIPMPTIPEVEYYWGPGENLIKAIWKNTDINEATQDAKESYEALAKLT